MIKFLIDNWQVILSVISLIFGFVSIWIAIAVYYRQIPFLVRIKTKPEACGCYLVEHGQNSRVENETTLKLLQLEFGKIRIYRHPWFKFILFIARLSSGLPINAVHKDGKLWKYKEEENTYLVWRGVRRYIEEEWMWRGMGFNDSDKENQDARRIERYPIARDINKELFNQLCS